MGRVCAGRNGFLRGRSARSVVSVALIVAEPSWVDREARPSLAWVDNVDVGQCGFELFIVAAASRTVFVATDIGRPRFAVSVCSSFDHLDWSLVAELQLAGRLVFFVDFVTWFVWAMFYLSVIRHFLFGDFGFCVAPNRVVDMVNAGLELRSVLSG